ncbi:ImmA/IrrE family metallo-endopeptidase [Clostridium tertium]|jgi:Zn-dependent peptidase ImmA (M78 family)|uniref:ImmA/IrrE family metallo-endopeptidase n=1 Tax=Clostridium tertium TaxID=1559 RepID=UPI0011588B91|nr:ImmA/IrrE family metallo-endopeptidase [Clostridium tertium]MDY4604845.1 ImmA/IrrE family metallo-endopeptidase [Clostridium tertium]
MRWIDDIVNGILEVYNTNNPYQLCRHLGIKIERVHHANLMLAEKDSIYYQNYFGNEIIFIRDDLYGYDEEFILKHELGHAILHNEIINSPFTNIGKLDMQANYFALALTGVRFDEIEMNGMTLEQIASCANVPYEPLAQLVNL